MSIASVVQHQADAVASGLFGSVLALGQATGASPPLPEGAPWWVGYLVSLVVATAPVVVVRILSAWAAGKEADAEGKREMGRELLHDSDPTNDPQAVELFARARKLDAEAAALRALGSKNN
jgi:hypothetical protein